MAGGTLAALNAAGIAAAAALATLAAAWAAVRAALNRYLLPRSFAQAFGPPGSEVLYVVAHPDDEIMIAGTIARLARSGYLVRGLYLTLGEDGPTGGLCPREALAETRSAELGRSLGVLGLASYRALRFRDRHLPEEDRDELLAAIRGAIAEGRPKAAIGFDREIGLYGHDDHVVAGRLAFEASAEPGSGVERYLEMTLAPPQAALARRLSRTFRERNAGGRALPVPDLGVGIWRFGGRKLRALRCHGTQAEVMRELLPFHDRVPWPVYFSIFHREYFKVVDLAKGAQG